MILNFDFDPSYRHISTHLVVCPRIYNSQNEETKYWSTNHAEQTQCRLHHIHVISCIVDVMIRINIPYVFADIYCVILTYLLTSTV